jgi:hypothetical protein
LISFSVKCEGVDSQIFTETIKNNIPTLSIRAVTEPGLQPFSGILACKIILADSKNATSIYAVNFTTTC